MGLDGKGVERMRGSSAASIPAPLRREVRLLSTILGRVLEESDGPELLADVERLRRATIAFRRDPTPDRRTRIAQIVDGFAPERAEQVARAFTCYFQLINLAEEHHRLRVLRGRDVAMEAVRDSLGAGVADARDALGDEGLTALLGRLEIMPVLTAHPTEARRRAIVETLWRIGALVEGLDHAQLSPSELLDVDRRLMEEVTALWRTGQVRARRPEPLDEVRAEMALFDQTIFDVLPIVAREMDRALAPGSGARPPAFDRPFLRWGTWVGGDRDGNPHVTADVTRRAVEIASEHVLLGLESEARRIARFLTASERDTPATQELLQRLAGAADVLPVVAGELERRLADSPHRRMLALAAHRLAATRSEASGRYPGADAFRDDLRVIQRSLAAAGAERLAYGELQHLLWQAEAFGFHLAELEVREHATVIGSALEELRSSVEEPTPATREVLATIRTMAELQGRFGPACCRRYVVSFTRAASDVLAVHELAALASGGRGFELDVVPLFETRADLAAAAGILDELVKAPVFADRVAASGGRVEVMLGYSDSAKEIGVLAANLAIYRAQVDLTAWARDHGLRLTIFHGRGGALGRGGGPASRAILGQAPGSVDGGFKTTEQGEVAFARYGNLRIAQRHLEQMTSAVLVASTPMHEARLEACWERFQPAAARMAEASETAYRALIGRPGFVGFFLRATPMDEIGSLALGSRPARRPAGPDAGDLTELRAIPWVFAWSQSRINLPGWYGLGSGLAAVAGERGGLARLRAMAAEWPFFTSFLENAELSLAKADAPIAELYLALGNDATIAAAIVEEHARTTDLVLSITGHDAPLAGRPLLRTAVDLRNPYVDALSFLQLRFLRAAREDPADAESRRLVQITINGVAAGLQNTG